MENKMLMLWPDTSVVSSSQTQKEYETLIQNKVNKFIFEMLADRRVSKKQLEDMLSRARNPYNNEHWGLFSGK